MGFITDNERYNQVIDTWTHVNSDLSDICLLYTSMKYPDFLEVQLKSFQDFLQLDTPPEKRKNDAPYKVFAENLPIADTRHNFVLEFLDYYIDPPHYSIDECLERGLTYRDVYKRQG